MSKRYWFSWATAVRVFALLLVIVLFLGSRKGLGDMTGLWQVDLALDGPGEPGRVTWLVGDLAPHPEQPDHYLASGCMQTEDTGKQALLAMEVVHHPELDSYTLTVYSTLIPAEGEPFVVRFESETLDFGTQIDKGKASGAFVSDPGSGSWSAVQRDGRLHSCEGAAGSGLPFWGDLYTHQDAAYTPPRYQTIYETVTLIVSSGMRVETPLGAAIDIPSHVDIFSPDTDFINEFRYLLDPFGMPIRGEVYTFTLLDVFGEPIPGATARDVWTGCTQGAPVDYKVEIFPGEWVKLSWAEVPPTEGWNPGGEPQVGYYQIAISALNGADSYGASGVANAYHHIPWQPFEPGSTGDPDGVDVGVSLGELEDGEYEVALYAFSVPPDGSDGYRLECFTSNSSHYQRMIMRGYDVQFIQFGTVSGRVLSEAGEPIPGAWVEACEYRDDPQFCRRQAADENGAYRLAGLPAGEYRVRAGVEGQPEVYYDDTEDPGQADRVRVVVGKETTGIDFTIR